MVRTTKREMYCQQCGEQQQIKKTVPWQADLCITCGSNVTE